MSSFDAFEDARVKDEVEDREGNHQVEERQPPARHGVVHFFEVAVPGVIDDFAFFGVAARFDVGRPVNESDVAQYVQDSDCRDEDADCCHDSCLLCSSCSG